MIGMLKFWLVSTLISWWLIQLKFYFFWILPASSLVTSLLSEDFAWWRNYLRIPWSKFFFNLFGTPQHPLPVRVIVTVTTCDSLVPFYFLVLLEDFSEKPSSFFRLIRLFLLTSLYHSFYFFFYIPNSILRGSGPLQMFTYDW